MRDSQLLRVMKSLESKELRRFEAFVHSPYFNTNTNTGHLLDYLVKYAPEFDSSHLEIGQVLKKLFPKEKQVQKVRDQMSILLKLLKRFLAEEQWQQNSFQVELALLQQLRQRHLDKLHMSHSKSLRSNLEKSGMLHDEQCFEAFLLDQESEAFFIMQDLRQTQDHIQGMVDTLDVFYIGKKLKLACEMFNRRNIVNKEYHFHLMKELEDILGKAGVETEYEHLQVPSIQLYLQIYQSLKSPDETEHFYQLLQLLDQHGAHFPVSELRQMYRYAQNYCIKKINKGDGQFMTELFHIFKKLLDSKVILEKSVIPHPDYKNIVTVGLRLKEFDWVLNFIEKYKNYLEPNYQTNAYHYNLATYYYETEDYDQVIELLRSVKFTDVYYEISSKYMLMKVYYDQNDFDLLSYLVISFEKLIKRNKEVSSQNRTGIVHFLQILKKLMRLKEQSAYKDKASIEAQRAKIEALLSEKKPITNLGWLKGKLEQF